MRKRQTFTAEFKCEAVRLLEQADKPASEIALTMAIMQRNPEPGLIHHTDRGRLYAAHQYHALLERHQMIPSMSRKQDC